MSSQHWSSKDCAKLPARVEASSRQEKTITTNAFRENNKCAAPGFWRSPVRKWISAIVTQAPVTIGHRMVIQVMADFPQDGLPCSMREPHR
jgi:hypothetical protein